MAVDSFSMHVDQGETVALIGPNGAGKTTAFNVITGVYAPTNGCVKLRGKIIAQGHPTGKMRKLYAGTHIGEYNTSSPTRLIKSPRWAWRAPSRTSVCSRTCPCWKTCW